MKKSCTKWNFTWLLLLIIGISGLNQKAYSQVANSGFETGTLASWTGTSNVTVSAGYTAGNWTVNPSGTSVLTT